MDTEMKRDNIDEQVLTGSTTLGGTGDGSKQQAQEPPADGGKKGNNSDESELSIQKLFRAALSEPSFIEKLLPVQKQWIADHYTKLFDKLQLDEESKAKFIELLAEKQIIKADAATTMHSKQLAQDGTNVPVIEIIEDAQAGVNAKIEKLLGEENYRTYYNFEMTDGLRSSLTRLQSSVASTPEPLSDQDIEQLVNVLDQTAPPDRRGGLAKFTGSSPLIASGLVKLPFTTPLPENAPTLLAPYLTTSQQNQLQLFMSQQQNEMKLTSARIAAARRAGRPTH